jgi:hypothetical protein
MIADETNPVAEAVNETRALLRKLTRFNKHELLIAALYIQATWADSGQYPETDVSLFRVSYPHISEHPVVQQMVHPKYRIGRS